MLSLRPYITNLTNNTKTLNTDSTKKKNEQCTISVSSRFSINKTIISDFALFAILDNEKNTVVCHLIYENGEEYCDEMANKMLAGLNSC